MGCSEYVDQLDGWLDGQAPAALQAAMEAHLKTCPGCRQITVACRETMNLYRQQRAPELPAALHDRVMAEISRRPKSAR